MAVKARRKLTSTTAFSREPGLLAAGQMAILGWLVIITWRYVQEATDFWAEGLPVISDADAFRALLVAWLVVIGATFLTGLTSRPLARRLCVQAVFGLALGAFLVIAVLSGAFLQILAFLWLFLLAYVVGNRLLQIIFQRQLGNGIEATVFSLGLGFAIYSLFTLALSLSGLLYKWVAIIPLLILSLLLRRELLNAIKGSFRGLSDLPHDVAAASGDFLSIALLTILAFLVVLSFIGAIGPEIRYDAVAYHLPVPQIYIQNHRLVEIPYIFRSYWPKGIEMIFCLGLLLGGQVTAKLFSFAFGLVVAAAIFAFCEDIVSPKAGLLAAALFYSAPLANFLASTAYVELGWTLFSFLAIYAVSRWLLTQDGRWIILGGLMCGFALASKTPALFVITPLSLIVFWASLWVHKKGLKTAMQGTIGFVVLTVLIGAPWYALTYLWTGNPVFPFLNAIFRSPKWPPVNEIFNFSMFGTGRDLVSLVRLPWDMVYQSRVFAEVPHGAIGVSLLIAVVLPLVAVAMRGVPKEIVLLALLALFCTAEWVLSVEYLRYYVPYLPMVSILAAYVVDRVYYERPRLLGARWASATILAVDGVLLAGLAATLPIFVAGFWKYEEMPYRVALGSDPRDEYLSRALRSYDSYQFLNRTYNAADVRVLEVGAYAPVYVDGEVYPALEECCRAVFGLMSEAGLQGWLHERGLTHLLVNYGYVHGTWIEDSPIMSRRFLEEHTALEYVAHGVAVYRLLSDTEIQRRARYMREVRELLQNPGFEDGKEGAPRYWGVHGSPRFDQSAEHSHSGQGAVRVSEHDYLTQSVPVRENEIYVLGEHVKAGPGGQTARLQVNWLDARGYVLASDIGVVPATSEWREHYMPVMAPRGAAVAEIFVTVHDPGRVWFDDLSLEPELGALPEPESFSSCLQLNTEEADDQLGLGWYGVEEDGVNRWRWMAREGWLLLGVEDGKQTLEITGHAVTEHFQQEGVLLQVLVNEQVVGEEWLEEGDFRLAYQVPGELRQNEVTRITLHLRDAFVPTGESRELGIIIHSICFR